MIRGLHPATLLPVEGWDRHKWAIPRILRTTIGTRLAPCDVVAANGEVLSIREFGSDIPPLVDTPTTEAMVVDFAMAAAEAIHRWEPELRLEQCFIRSATPGEVEIDLVLTDLTSGETRTLPVTL